MTSWRERWRRGLMAIGPALAFGARERVEVERLPPLESRILGEARTIDVFLPRGYRSDTLGRYPVLYANDGQDMSTVDLAGVLDSLQASGAMSPALVVAIHATERIEDYGTAGIPNAQELGIRSARYQQFLLEEVMPVIETRYRVETGPGHTAMMGWSLGGLSAFDLTWLHSDRFGSVGVFSGSFWWRTDDSSPAAKQASRIMHRRIRETSVRPSIRMWFQTGMHDESSDRDGDGVIDAIQDTEELIAELVRKGYHRGTDIVDLTVEGKHDLPTWKRLLPEFLKWAFPSRREG
jgi:enterochelin esterase-like enzyme